MMDFNKIFANTIDETELTQAEERVKTKVFAYMKLKKREIITVFLKKAVIPFVFSCSLGIFVGIAFTNENSININTDIQNSPNFTNMEVEDSYPSIILYDNIMEKIYE